MDKLVEKVGAKCQRITLMITLLSYLSVCLYVCVDHGLVTWTMNNVTRVVVGSFLPTLPFFQYFGKEQEGLCRNRLSSISPC